MRNVVYGVGISLDGYIARPNGAVDFLFMPKDYSMAPFFKTVDTAVMGRKTFDVSLAMGGSYGPDMATYVYSRTLPAGEHQGAVILNEPVASFVETIRKKPGKDIWLMGGGDMARHLLSIGGSAANCERESVNKQWLYAAKTSSSLSMSP